MIPAAQIWNDTGSPPNPVIKVRSLDTLIVHIVVLGRVQAAEVANHAATKKPNNSSLLSIQEPDPTIPIKNPGKYIAPSPITGSLSNRSGVNQFPYVNLRRTHARYS